MIMGVIITLRNEIESIIKSMDQCDYLRANPGEANIRLEEQAVDHCIAIHIDQSTATASSMPSNSTWIVKNIPIEILFVYKNTYLDDKLYDLDSLVDKAEDKADEFYDYLMQSGVINDLGELEDYECQRLEAYKRFDSILTGVLFTWTAPVSRTKYYCV